VKLVVNPAGDFGISATPSSLTIVRGNSGTYTVSIGALQGFTGSVSLKVTGVPSRVTASFNPATVNIRAGQTVEWRNTSIIGHTVTDNPPAAANAADSTLPPGAIPFSSGDIPAGKIFAYKFTVPGTYRYFCTHRVVEISKLYPDGS